MQLRRYLYGVVLAGFHCSNEFPLILQGSVNFVTAAETGIANEASHHLNVSRSSAEAVLRLKTFFDSGF